MRRGAGRVGISSGSFDLRDELASLLRGRVGGNGGSSLRLSWALRVRSGPSVACGSLAHADAQPRRFVRQGKGQARCPGAEGERSQLRRGPRTRYDQRSLPGAARTTAPPLSAPNVRRGGDRLFWRSPG